MEQNKIVRVYAAGGAGNSIASTMEGFRKNKEPGFASIEIAYIDTSGSDFQGVTEDNIYRFKGIDGSGGLRAENHEIIAKYVGDILQAHPPGFLNVVLSSGGGGSGSVIGPSITNELLRKGENVVVIVIGGVDTRTHIQNTQKTIRSYENLSIRHKRALLLRYFQNESSAHRKEIDQQVRHLMISLSILFSGQNKSLDSKDLEHWINFNKVTTFDAQMVALETVTSLDDLASDRNIVSVATIAPMDGDTDLARPVEVQFVGYVPVDMSADAQERLPLHFVTTDGLFDDLDAQFERMLSKMDEEAGARVKRESIVSDKDIITNNGVVL